jgi:hypothetical protein
MRVTAIKTQTERKRQDKFVHRAEKRGRMTKVTLIRGPIHPHSSALTTAVEAESANHLIWREVVSVRARGVISAPSTV